ncbi:uncharacterized protein BXZ73DRAFT_18521, partial [Epithele typhae]|uniref:uncharacterized protein n=1 Tax=Epithele typhae TaxID=378194 RepID=UPI002008580E
YKQPEIDAAWKETRKTAEKYSDELVDQWNKEIDGLLTFDGLFSAALTAFNTIAFAMLQPQSNDQTNAILTQVSAQLKSFALNPSFVNSTALAFGDIVPTPFRPETWVVWVNALWFTSLTFSLSSGTIGIMVKQWLKEYNTGLYGFSAPITRRRIYRLENLNKAYIPFIISLVPLLLIVAVILFFAGLLVLLFHSDVHVFAATATLVGMLLLFVIVTTIIPSMHPSMCYFSPQSRAFHSLWSVVL